MTPAIDQLLAEKAGLNLEVFGRHAVDRAVAARMESCALTDQGAYLNRLRGSREELNELVESLTVLETWFFRDRGPFEFLREYAQGRSGLRVLSAPCATGEEAYSIAITLLEAGLPPGTFHRVACDLSRNALEQAWQAAYGARSFREDLPACSARWFQSAGRGFLVRPEVTALVQFQRDDLLNPVFLESQAPYDVMFCRNLLIYLGAGAQKSLIDRIGRCLSSDGVVVTGHAEMGVLLRQGWEALPGPACFACRKSRTPESSTAIPSRPRPDSAAPPGFSRMPACPTDKPDALLRARQLADSGAFEEAWRLCDEVLGKGPDAGAYYLEGLISAARDRLAEAGECFRKALYLDPSHYEALIQMSLLCARSGQPEREEVFRLRAARVAAQREEASDAGRF